MAEQTTPYAKIKPRWTEAEDTILRQEFPRAARERALKDLAKRVGRPVDAMRERAARLGLTSPIPRWTAEQVAILHAEFLTARDAGQLPALAAKLGRSVAGIEERARCIGLAGATRPWTQEDDDRLRAGYAIARRKRTVSVLAQSLHRLPNGIHGRARVLGLVVISQQSAEAREARAYRDVVAETIAWSRAQTRQALERVDLSGDRMAAATLEPARAAVG